MKQEIQNALHVALTLIAKTHHIAEEELNQPIELERCKDPAHGDFATNLAMRYAKIFKMNPKELADQIVVSVPLIESVASMEVAGPGFVNIRLSHDSETAVLKTIMEQGDSYGRHKALQPQKILLEYVSANPTGPLHVGHGRGAAFGDTLANVLRANGHEVDEEYYVNDAGRQMDILALSVYWRYLEKQQKASALPKGLYQGEYVFELAEQLKETVGENLAYALEDWLSEMPQDWSEAQIEAGARDVFIDQAIADLKAKLGEADYRKVFDVALEAMVADIREDLAQFGVEFARWYSERSLYDEHKVEKALDILQEQGFLYEKEGAMWFRATDFGDEKDRVVRRENGVTTYFASDIAYHLDKYERGYDEMIDIFGADHHGYMARVRASLAALDLDPSQLKIILVQFAVLYKDGQKMQMSTRSGEFVTLRALREAVTSDAARFFYVMRRPEQHLDFDMDLAVSHSKDNPFYYVEYAHARTCRVLEKAESEGLLTSDKLGLEYRLKLKLKEEKMLLKELARYPEVVLSAGEQYSAHPIVNYLRELAGAWHHYYDAGHKLLHDDETIRAPRLTLTAAVQQVLRNALAIIGVKALDKM